MQPLLRLGWSEWKSLELLEEMPHPSQVLPLIRTQWKHLPCPTYLMWTLESISFPSSCPPPIASWLVSPSPKFQIPTEIMACVSLKFCTLMKECFPLGSQNTNHNPRNVESSNLSTCSSCTLCDLSLDLSISQGVLKLQIWYPSEKSVKHKYLHWLEKNTKLVVMKSRCQLEDINAIHNGSNKCGMVGS